MSILICQSLEDLYNHAGNCVAFIAEDMKQEKQDQKQLAELKKQPGQYPMPGTYVGELPEGVRDHVLKVYERICEEEDKIRHTIQQRKPRQLNPRNPEDETST